MSPPKIYPYMNCRGRMSVGGYTLAAFWMSEGVPIAEISRRLRISRKAVRKSLARGPPDARPARLPRPSYFARALQRRRGVVKRLTLRLNPRGVGRMYPSCAAIVRALPEEMKVCAMTVRRDLLAMGFLSRRRQRGPANTADDAVKRVAVCRQNLVLPPGVKKFFSDEKLFDINDHGAGSEWCAPGQAPSRRMKSRWAPSVHVWGIIAQGYRRLIILPIGSINAQKYVRLCLSKVRADLAGGIFMQDGAPCHTANSTKAYLARMGIRVMEWSARSPDLNPIETLWAIVQRAVSLRGPKDRDELIRFVQQEWDRIPQSTIDALCASYEARCRECIRLRGATVA